MLPIETVVELLMENIPNNWMWTLDGNSVSGSSRDELEKEVRTYLESLVPAPKPLSECEQGVRYRMQCGEHCDVYRNGILAKDAYGHNCGFAKDFKVIQPVEVSRG